MAKRTRTAAAIANELAAGRAPGSDLLAEFLAACESHSTTSALWRDGLARLRAQEASGARLTFGLGSTPQSPDRSLAVTSIDRWCWWPRGIPAGPWMALVSSRMGRQAAWSTAWFDLFRDGCRRVQERSGVLFSGAGMTTGRFAPRAAAIWRLPVLLVRAPRPRQGLDGWLRSLPRRPFLPEIYEAHLSPPLGGSPAACESLEDRVVWEWSQQIYLLGLRPRGNMAAMLERERVRGGLGRLVIADLDELVPAEMAEPLFLAGAARWALPPRTAAAGQPDQIAKIESREESKPRQPPDSHDIVGEWDGSRSTFVRDSGFLSHCTHAPRGRWPDESAEEHLDELLLGRGRRRTAFDALERIVRRERIVATGEALRGGVPAVCFSELPLKELLALRAFQSQRRCWSFESYGIRIDRGWLIARGARPVVYGDEAFWTRLSTEERPFFQLRRSIRGSRRKDWSREREWRHLGDVDLTELPAEAAVVFVATTAEAELLRPWSRWPVLVPSSRP